MTQLSLNPEANLDLMVDEVLCGKSGPWALENDLVVLLRMLREHKGAAQALPLETISTQLGMQARMVKSGIKSLIEDFNLPIGASRQDPCGYFLIVTAEDLEHALRPLTGEIRSMARRVRKLSSPKRLGEIFSQVQMEMEDKKATSD